MRKQSPHTMGANQESFQKDTAWFFEAEVSMVDFIRMAEGGSKPGAGRLFQDWGIPPEFLSRVIGTLADFARQAMMQAHPGIPAVIRLFCQEKLIQAVEPAEIVNPEPTADGVGFNLQAVPKNDGGWGFFIVDRNEDIPGDRPASSAKIIDLYVYREMKRNK